MVPTAHPTLWFTQLSCHLLFFFSLSYVHFSFSLSRDLYPSRLTNLFFYQPSEPTKKRLTNTVDVISESIVDGYNW